MATVKITKENFNDIIDNNEIVIIDFWASWCGPCRTFAPIFEEASEKHSDVVFGKINTEEEQELSAYFKIRSIPNVTIFRQQIGLFSQPGALPAEALDGLLTQIKEADMDEIRQKIAENESAENESAEN